MIPQTDYVLSRVIIFMAVLLLSIIVMAISKKWLMPIVIVVASLTLPITEQLTGNAFAYLYVATGLFWLIRSIPISLLRYREIKSSLSVLSIKNAIDALRTGVMFFERDGFILLVNMQMQQLMTMITGKIERNGKHFFNKLTLGEIEPRCRIEQFENQSIIILQDNTAWMFTLTDLSIKGTTYFQLTATDITERWMLVAELQERNADLAKRQEKLQETIANLHILSRERETQNMKMRTHDLLSENLVLLRQAMRKEQTPDFALLRSLSEGLLNILKTTESPLSPHDELEILKQTFSTIGVEIVFDGKLPDDIAKGKLFVDIAREAITNAVRHGFATQVRINANCSENTYQLTITDNGRASSGEISEGEGIAGMKRRVLEWGGKLAFRTSPVFTLTVTIPAQEG
jgi:hypothetical protein